MLFPFQIEYVVGDVCDQTRKFKISSNFFNFPKWSLKCIWISWTNEKVKENKGEWLLIVYHIQKKGGENKILGRGFQIFVFLFYHKKGWGKLQKKGETLIMWRGLLCLWDEFVQHCFHGFLLTRIIDSFLLATTITLAIFEYIWYFPSQTSLSQPVSESPLSRPLRSNHTPFSLFS